MNKEKDGGQIEFSYELSLHVVGELLINLFLLCFEQQILCIFFLTAVVTLQNHVLNSKPHQHVNYDGYSMTLDI